MVIMSLEINKAGKKLGKNLLYLAYVFDDKLRWWYFTASYPKIAFPFSDETLLS